jgi:uracil phosphoribosyltransferase
MCRFSLFPFYCRFYEYLFFSCRLSHYYTKLPPGIAGHRVLLCDPMLATGGSALAALRVLCGDPHRVPPSRICFVNLLSCPEGLRAVHEAFPEVTIVTAMIDQGLNDDKYIVPGLGDFGDRFYGTEAA